MMLTSTKFSAMTAAMLAALAGANPAVAGGPESIDRVPSNAAIIISLRSMESFVKEFDAFEKAMGLPAGGDNPIAQAEALLGTKGLNPNGSMSVAIMPEADGSVDFDADEPNGLMIIPVANYADFVKGLGGSGTDGIQAIKFDEKDAFVKDIGGGYAAISNVKSTIDTFDGKGGKAAAHAASFGATGASIADRADMVLFMNMAMFRDKIKEGLAEGKAGMGESPLAMGGEGMLKAADQMFGFMSDFADQAQGAVFGVDFTEKGVKIDLGAQFKEGTEMAGYFAKSGDSGALLSRLPNQAFLMAGAFDTSSEGVRQGLAKFTEFTKQMQGAVQQAAAANGADIEGMGDMSSLMSLTGDFQKSDGTAFCLGASPSGIMGGLFTNTSTYQKTKEGAAIRAASKKTIESMNGKKIAGMNYKSTYASASATIKGVEVDSWSATMEPAEDDPNAMQMQMMMGLVFGAGGMGGMTASVDGGIVSTMSQNTLLMTSAIDAAKAGNGLGSDPAMVEIQSNLPKNRIFEFYLGTKSIIDAGAGLMQMAGGEASFVPPAKVSPVAFAGTAGGGGMGMHVFLPADVIKAMAEIQAQMDAGGEDEPMDDAGNGNAGGGDQPRF